MVQEIKFTDYSGNGSIMVNRLPESWVLTNAHVKAMAEWNEQQIEGAKDAGVESMKAKWRDFKVYYNIEHADSTTVGNMLPNDYELSDHSANAEYQWVASEFVVPNVGSSGTTVEYDMHMLGADNGATSKGCILAYADSRARPEQQDPNIVLGPTGGLYSDMEDVGEDLDEIVGNWSRQGVVAPYPISRDNLEENYPGGSQFGLGGGTGILEATLPTGDSIRTIASAFVAPLGLLRIARTDVEGALSITIKVAAGNYQGVMAQPMKDAN